MTEQDQTISQSYLQEAIHQLSEGRDKIKHCVDQLTDEQLVWRPHPMQNSIANLLLHLSGNLRQWIIAGVGDQADVRNRPQEFKQLDSIARDPWWAEFQQTVQKSIEALQHCFAKNLLQEKTIQDFNTTSLAAIFDSVAHFRGHTQEIISLTRQQLGEKYQFDFVPQTKAQGA